ncbi:MAG: hypothetical protein GY844_29885 [Bradyrhizobium sp.]|nr:hypothetical protein [Bradyrhizobium sp.]
MPNCITIITPIKPASTERCRTYLRENAEPRIGMQCTPQFGFDRIPNLHFASFVILEATADFEPSLVFEATFDGPKADFVSDLLQVAGNGMHELYQHCAGYPAASLTTPELAKEYLIDHDTGTNIYFSGSPGRTVGEIKGESRIHSRIVSYLSRLQTGDNFAPRLNGLFSGVRAFIERRASRRWAEQAAPVPWEVRFRLATVTGAVIAALLLACLIGAVLALVCDWSAVGQGRWPLSASLTAFLAGVGRFGNSIASFLFGADAVRPEIFLAVGLTVIWVALRLGELVLSSWSKHPRDQFFLSRVPLHIVVILRYAALVFLAGAILLALIPVMGKHAFSLHVPLLLLHLVLLVLLLLVLAALQYVATTLKISVELKKLDGPQENWRRWWLDLVRFAMVMTVACVALIVSRYVPSIISTATSTSVVNGMLLIAAYGLIGVLAVYLLGLLLLMVVRWREWRDECDFADPAALEARAVINAKKYEREEGGNNRFQNHLASLTLVKPGLVHGLALRATLFGINLLSRFWFNVGTLGDIPTILSARWVLIDGGRRLLFLDNYGGAWDSYLNEFIDMAAVKGLNAIWTNTFVEVEGKECYTFPGTRFYFWQGAQAEQPFKAYVRQSQIETIVWYSAYPVLSVVNINTSTAARQSLSEPLAACDIDAVVQNL